MDGGAANDTWLVRRREQRGAAEKPATGRNSQAELHSLPIWRELAVHRVLAV
jgi:hypothetical protein